MGIHASLVLAEYEKDELTHPVPRKIVADRTIYLSRPLPLTFGPLLLCDLGERLGDEELQDDVMPDIYRAPEVIIGMEWGYKVWDLFEPDRLFQARDSSGEHDDAYHSAQMVAVLGPPPLDFLKRGTNYLKYWDENGTWKGVAPISDIYLAKLERRLTGDDKDAFLHFIRRMLRWIPEERPTAEEMVFDPWLMEAREMDKLAHAQRGKRSFISAREESMYAVATHQGRGRQWQNTQRTTIPSMKQWNVVDVLSIDPSRKDTLEKIIRGYKQQRMFVYDMHMRSVSDSSSFRAAMLYCCASGANVRRMARNNI
ncbi:hypothetical protein GX51_02605 [Blastomyces parvus]|uniref:Protein kinase domain-containing protein n=1 Tax=Blastomyces parvus TaxID=2060905 RepID=A0A2B7X2Y6_9EURO|nr:hypothetical protein GX51_02605 [Blastomyces parvus]